MVTYQTLHTQEQLQAVVDLEIDIWQMSPRDAISLHMLFVINHNGGLILGALDGRRMIGASVALPVPRPHGLVLWSHLTAVLPDYQGQGVGFGLKQEQRKWALAQDYPAIHWTYDPLQRGNASFNLHRLGARSSLYHVNFYGRINDGINSGLDSDRLEVNWPLAAAKTGRGGGQTALPSPAESHFLLWQDAEGRPQLAQPLMPSDERCYVEIPCSIRTIKEQDMGLAQAWQQALRQTLLQAFGAGWELVDFHTQGGRCWYVLGH